MTKWQIEDSVFLELLEVARQAQVSNGEENTRLLVQFIEEVRSVKQFSSAQERKPKQIVDCC